MAKYVLPNSMGVPRGPVGDGLHYEEALRRDYEGNQQPFMTTTKSCSSKIITSLGSDIPRTEWVTTWQCHWMNFHDRVCWISVGWSEEIVTESLHSLCGAMYNLQLKLRQLGVYAQKKPLSRLDSTAGLRKSWSWGYFWWRYSHPFDTHITLCCPNLKKSSYQRRPRNGKHSNFYHFPGNS